MTWLEWLLVGVITVAILAVFFNLLAGCRRCLERKRRRKAWNRELKAAYRRVFRPKSDRKSN